MSIYYIKQFEKENTVCPYPMKTAFIQVWDSRPLDIVILLDKSEAMEEEAWIAMKVYVEQVLSLLEQKQEQALRGEKQKKIEIGLVGFSTEGILEIPFGERKKKLKKAIHTLKTAGKPNVKEGFARAIRLFDFDRPSQKLILFMGSGDYAKGENPIPIISAAKGLGIEIYCLYAPGEGPVHVESLIGWASEPSISHVFEIPFLEDMETAFFKWRSAFSFFQEKDPLVFSEAEALLHWAKRNHILLCDKDVLNWLIYVLEKEKNQS